MSKLQVAAVVDWSWCQVLGPGLLLSCSLRGCSLDSCLSSTDHAIVLLLDFADLGKKQVNSVCTLRTHEAKTHECMLRLLCQGQTSI